MFSVTDSQPEELQQLLVVWLNEVRWLLPALVLQLRVSTQREKVAERNTRQPCLLKEIKSCCFGKLNSVCHTSVSGGSVR